MALVHPVCKGMRELDFARLERERLSQIIELSGCQDLPQRLLLATDSLELHILHGYAVTTGSAYGYAAPSRDACFQLFTAVHDLRDNNPAAPLSVGGRAFTKHAHRSASWWPSASGSNQVKNANAESCFERIWTNATWLNVFWLPHGILAFEIRLQEGYGMRFQRPVHAKEWTFRGFVEPAVPDGHASKPFVGRKQCVCYDWRTNEAALGGHVKSCREPLGRFVATGPVIRGGLGFGDEWPCGRTAPTQFSHMCCDECSEWGCDIVNNEPNPSRDYIDENRFNAEWVAWDATTANGANKEHDYKSADMAESRAASLAGQPLSTSSQSPSSDQQPASSASPASSPATSSNVEGPRPQSIDTPGGNGGDSGQTQQQTQQGQTQAQTAGPITYSTSSTTRTASSWSTGQTSLNATITASRFNPTGVQSLEEATGGGFTYTVVSGTINLETFGAGSAAAKSVSRSKAAVVATMLAAALASWIA